MHRLRDRAHAGAAGLPVHGPAHQPGLIAVGFSPSAALAALAAQLSWPGPFLTDERRELYRALGLPRASLLSTYSAGTLLHYAVAGLRRHRPHRPVDAPRQLGGDAILRDGRSPRSGAPALRPTGSIRRGC